MKLYIKTDINIASKRILQDQFGNLNIQYILHGLGEIEIVDSVTADKMKLLNAALGAYGIEIIENSKSILVQKIKDTIVELVYSDDELPASKTSAYLADKLNHSYGYLSNLFSEVTYSTIENYIIFQKTERAKKIIATDDFTFTEISLMLNYSSVAHFSTQFKNATGLTPSAFKRIINKRRNTSKMD